MCVCASYINLGGLVEGSVGMNVVVEDDNTHHHSHTEQQSVLAVEPAGVVTEGGENREYE